jgi:hypothetical protein
MGERSTRNDQKETVIEFLRLDYLFPFFCHSQAVLCSTAWKGCRQEVTILTGQVKGLLRVGSPKAFITLTEF